MHTADPRLVPDARPIPTMSFSDVADLGAFGSRVLHPAAMVPLRQERIPLRVRNTHEPSAAGTLVREAVDGGRAAIRAIAYRQGVALLTVRSQRLVPQHTFLSKVFRGLEEVGCEAGPIVVGEAAVTVAVEDAHVTEVVEALGRSGDVEAVSGRAVVGLIGDVGLEGFGGIGGVLDVLGRAGISAAFSGVVTMGSAVALSVPADQLVATVALLHAECDFGDR